MNTNGADASAMDNVWDFSATETRHNVLLNSNEVPLDSDISLVQSALETADARLAYLDAEMSRIREQLRQLEDEHAALSIHCTKTKAILSPLRHMPPEVLSEIFRWTLPPTRNAVFHAGFKMTDSPWVLTHVSRRWRELAVSNPSMWSLVVIVYTPDMDPSSSYALPMVEAQIARAKNLKIHFYGCEGIDSVPQINTFQCLAKHASLWEELDVELTSALFPLLAGLRGRIPSLRRLWLQWDRPESQRGADSIDFCESAPSLVDVGVLSQNRLISFPLPAHQLTRYQLTAPWEMHGGILKQAQNITEAHIRVILEGGPMPTYNEIIDLPCLQNLPVSHSDILQSLRFPRLEQLSIEVEQGESPVVVNHLQSALVRSSCPLRSLCFDGHPHSPTITTILQAFPAIDELAIIVDNYAATDSARKLMHDLTVSDDAATVQLSRISFGFIGQRNVHRGVFLDMVKSRWEMEKGALKQMALLMDLNGMGPRPKTPKSDRLRIAALREQGLDFAYLRGAAAANAIDKWRCSAQWT
ncbi:hypothetical protein DFH06DRAFT_598641 [Mycena polygramma]|nr:hypothetical protein DFH06DRAFT_598641 [Mycena polygramma]